MAQGKYLTALIRAHLFGDDKSFRQLAIQLAAVEAKSGHDKLAISIRNLLDSTTNGSQGQHTGRITPSLNGSGHRADLSGLLHASFREERLTDIILSKQTRESVERVLQEWRNGPLLESYSLTKRSKLLLVGPPGCGKTLSAKVIAGEVQLPLFVVKLDGLISRFLGETSVHLTNIFNAMATTPGVYLFDEFDSIGTTRGERRDVGEVSRVLSTFLLLLENFSGNSLVIAATNYENALDDALFRRFDDVIHFPMPSQAQLGELLKLRLAKFPHEKTNFTLISKAALGMNYAEVSRAVNEAIKMAVMQHKKSLDQSAILEAINKSKSLTASHRKKIAQG
jgi:SpoVK/Ycf46/Vps4 family AAA+-type ATPase